jgi:pyruvate-formate lyase-activating enzyme
MAPEYVKLFFLKDVRYPAGGAIILKVSTLDQRVPSRKCVLDGVSYEQNETIGKVMTTSEVMKEIEKDRIFYEESGGGVTFSGGEPLIAAQVLN